MSCALLHLRGHFAEAVAGTENPRNSKWVNRLGNSGPDGTNTMGCWANGKITISVKDSVKERHSFLLHSESSGLQGTEILKMNREWFSLAFVDAFTSSAMNKAVIFQSPVSFPSKTLRPKEPDSGLRWMGWAALSGLISGSPMERILWPGTRARLRGGLYLRLM